MVSSFSEILTWVKDLKYWEKAAFDLLLSKKSEILDEEIDLLCDYMLEDEGVEPAVLERPELKFEEYLISDDDCLKSQLVRISNLQNINALVPNQTLEFGTNLTVIFGANGSGKSGYARVLGSAGFTRGDEEIIRDIKKPFNVNSPQMVDITMRYGEKETLIQHKIGSHCPELISFYVFDSTSVNVHLTKENTLNFSPTSLMFLQEIATLTDRVRNQLRNRIERKIKPNPFISAYVMESEIKEKIKNLSYESDIQEIENLVNISPIDLNTNKDLQTRVATIETQGVSEKRKNLEEEISDLKLLQTKINQAIEQTNKRSIDNVNKAIKEHCAIVDAAKKLGLDNFKGSFVRSIGSEEWHNFLNSSKILAETEYPDGNYPEENSFCLFC